MSEHREYLTKRKNALEKEIQEMSKTFEVKKEEFLKLLGAIEMLDILDKEAAMDAD
jgi:hypothetical protein